MKKIVLLGSTGSVGKNVLNVARLYPDKFSIIGLSSNRNTELLKEQANEFKTEHIVVADDNYYNDLKKGLGSGINAASGEAALETLAGNEDADIIFISIAGRASLKPLIAALSNGKTVALASKEPIVSAGELLNALMKKHNSKILSVDSEHYAIFKCLSGRKNSDIGKILLIGTGGPLKNRKKEDFKKLTIEEVLNHPKWKMGRKITVDSATLMNKGLEIIEAKWLFDIPEDIIEVVIHPEAIIHSMVEFIDGTVNAFMYQPDMKFPILSSLSYPDTFPSNFPRIDFPKLGSITFYSPDRDKFPALALAYESIKSGGTMPAVLNSSNETAVKLFLDGKIDFTNIMEKVQNIINKHKPREAMSIDDILEAEDWAHEEVLRTC